MTEKIAYTAHRLPDARFIAGGLLGILVVLLGLYGFFLNQTVLNIVARKDLENRVAEIDTVTSTLEFEYITQNSDVTLEKALALGYVEAQDDQRYVKGGSGSRFTLRD